MFSSFYIKSYNRAPKKEQYGATDHTCSKGIATGKALNGDQLNRVNGIHKQSNGFSASPELNVEDLSPNTKKND